MKQFIINLLCIIYILILISSSITLVMCIICCGSNKFPDILWLSLPIEVICISAAQPIGRFFGENDCLGV